MAMRVNPAWQNEIESRILQNRDIEETVTYAPAGKWLVATLSKYGVPFKVNRLPLGVSVISTKTDACPCCKRKI